MMILTPTNGSINNYVRCMKRKNEPYVPISVCEKCRRRGECKEYKEKANDSRHNTENSQ